MAECIDKQNCANGIETFQGENAAHGRTSVRCRPSQRLHHLECKFLDLRVCCLNVGILRGRSGEIVKMLESRSVDICCVQETRFRRKSVGMIHGKAAEYKLSSIWK